jgi:hypothetical protein
MDQFQKLAKTVNKERLNLLKKLKFQRLKSCGIKFKNNTTPG